MSSSHRTYYNLKSLPTPILTKSINHFLFSHSSRVIFLPNKRRENILSLKTTTTQHNTTMVAGDEARTLVFTYGTLKKGFSNHVLIQDMAITGDAVFIGNYRTFDKYPLVCGPYRVPFLLDLTGSGDRVTGELYSVSNRALARMDELEGISRGHYERLPIKLIAVDDRDRDDESCGGVVVAEAYYAHRSYATELWKKNGETGFESYNEKVARGYVKRVDRPRDLSFLEQIRLFVSSSD